MNGLNLSVNTISNIVEGTLLFDNQNNFKINNVLTDSRLISGNTKSTLFIAIKTPRNDGHKYIQNLIDKGINSFIVTDVNFAEKIYNKNKSNNNLTFILVDNAIKALQQIAKYYRSTLTFPIVAITGSNGKTVVKEWLWQILSSNKKVSRSPKSYNSQIGVPLSILKLERDSDFGIIEAGISEVGEMDILEDIIKPDIGIITNVGTAHLSNFKDKKQLATEKLKLFKNAKKIIYNINDSFVKDIVESTFSHKSNTYNSSNIDNCSSINSNKVELDGWDYSQITKYIPENVLDSKFSDKASLQNICHCISVIKNLGLDINCYVQNFLYVTPVEMRLEVKEGVNNCLLVNDSYSLDIDSFVIAIDTLMKQSRYSKKTVIVSDFQKSNNKPNIYSLAEIINTRDIYRVILIGEELIKNSNLFSVKKLEKYTDTEDFIDNYKTSDFNNEAILIKGARKFNFEKISSLLQEKEHETVLEINVEALIHNLNQFKKLLKPQTKLLVMVKAFSYGVGSLEMANILQENYVDYMAVAFVDEGIEIRSAGIKVPIVVMNPNYHSLNTMIKYDLEPEIYSINRLQQFCEIVRSVNLKKQYPIHIKIDTGMHRLGFSLDEIDTLIKILIENKDIIKVSSIFSHLACADDPNKDEFTQLQISRLQKVAKTIEDSLNYKITRHILNSWGIMRFPESQMEMVRLGIGLYGTEPELIQKMNLETALRLRTIVSQIRYIPKGDGLGYGQTWIAKQDSKIAILPIGYADGFRLSLSNSNYKVLIKDHKVPVIGRICMDMCFVDITNLDIKEGDEVEIFGPNIPISQLAETANTITYEIISTLSQRIKRIYLH